MFYFLSKLLAVLIFPTGLLLTLLVFIRYSKNHTKIRQLATICILLTYLGNIPLITNTIFKNWEWDTGVLAPTESFDVGILLTGGIFNENAEMDRMTLGRSGDRIWQTLRLYRDGRIIKIIVSGGQTGIFKKQEFSESDLCLKYLEENGVKRSDIWIENASRNTYENAKFTAKVLKQHPEVKSSLLITSAFHLKRAIACFEKAGIKAKPFATCYLTDRPGVDLSDFLPAASSGQDFELIIKELVGFFTYKILGYC